MRIALATLHVHRHGGVPLYVANLATALAQDHEVTIFSNGFEGLEGTGIRHCRVWILGGGLIQFATFSVASSLLCFLSRFKREGRFDVIHAHNYDCAALADVITSHFCEGAGYYWLRRQGPGVTTLGERLERQGKALLERGLVSQSRSRPIIILSQRMKEEFLSHYGSMEERLFVIPSGVDPERFNPANIFLYRDEIRSRHSTAVADILVLFVGRYWERKGLPQAIRALPRLHSPDVTLLVVGSGNTARYRELARREGVERRVIFVGPSEETWKYYAASDIFLLPSLYEPFGLVVLEAMATGLPVVVSRDAGVAELVQDGFDALLLEDPGDPSEIAAKLDLLVEDAGLRRRLGERACQTAQGYTWAQVAQRTVEVYRQARSGRRD